MFGKYDPAIVDFFKDLLGMNAPRQAQSPLADLDAGWGRTHLIEMRLEDNAYAEKRDGEFHYRNRRVIGRDTPVLGGVYMGGGAREAIVVSDDDGQLSKLLREVKSRCITNGQFDSTRVLTSVFDVVDETFICKDPYAVNDLINKVAPEKDQKVSIGVFISEGKGVCRHMALTCAALLEMLKNENLITGTASVDRNEVRLLGVHAWCRYKNRHGITFVLDVMHGFRGTLEASVNDAQWNYQRPEDY